MGSGRGDRNQWPVCEGKAIGGCGLQWGPVVVTGISGTFSHAIPPVPYSLQWVRSW